MPAKLVAFMLYRHSSHTEVNVGSLQVNAAASSSNGYATRTWRIRTGATATPSGITISAYRNGMITPCSAGIGIAAGPVLRWSAGSATRYRRVPGFNNTDTA